MHEDFEAFKFEGAGSCLVEVVSFNKDMAICGDDRGPVIITKEQAMEFFGIDVNRVEALEAVIKKLIGPGIPNCTVKVRAQEEAARLLASQSLSA